MKKKLNFIKRLIAGQNVLGEALFAIVDVLPFPNVLNIPRAILKARPDIETRDLLLETIRKTDTVRLLLGVALSYLILSGRLSFETLTSSLSTLTRALEFIDRVFSVL